MEYHTRSIPSLSLSLSVFRSLCDHSILLIHPVLACISSEPCRWIIDERTFIREPNKWAKRVSESAKKMIFTVKKMREIVTTWTWMSLPFHFSNRNYSTLILRIVSKIYIFLDSVTICVTALEPHVWWISAPSVVDSISARALAQTCRLCIALVARFQHRWLWTAPAFTFQSTHSGQLLQSVQFSAPNKTHPELDDLKLAPNHLNWLQWLQAASCKYNKANVRFCKMAHKWLASERLGNLKHSNCFVGYLEIDETQAATSGQVCGAET